MKISALFSPEHLKKLLVDDEEVVFNILIYHRTSKS